MKLVSLNVSVFEPNNDPLVKFLSKQKFDFVCLQEVTRAVEDSTEDKYISLNTLRDATPSLKYFFFGPSTVMAPFEQKNFHGKKVFRFNAGGLLEYGNYTASKFKILKAQSIFVQNWFTFTSSYSNWPEEDYRSVLVTDHDINGKKLRILNYHGIWTRNKLGNEKTLTANKIINDIAKEAKGEAIICGDFNLFPNTPSMKIFEKKFVSLIGKYNVKTTRPKTNELNGSKRNVVDYVWVSKGVKVNKFEVVESNVSDHLPLVLDFDL